MRSFISVLDHPFFAVTDEDGKYEIKGLPAGEYEVEARAREAEEPDGQDHRQGREKATLDLSYKG